MQTFSCINIHLLYQDTIIVDCAKLCIFNQPITYIIRVDYMNFGSFIQAIIRLYQLTRIFYFVTIDNCLSVILD
jgi:hypothetical protein